MNDHRGGAGALGVTNIPPRIHPAILRVLAKTGADARLHSRASRKSFRSLDRSLKVFLRFSNLPGLEYRLRLAGFNSLEDLAETDKNSLCAHGFTPLMSQQLLIALENYVLRQLDRSEEMLLPFQLVRKGQKIKSSPTAKMKELPTFGKQNIKRQRSSDKKATKSKKSESASKVKLLKQPTSIVRLMSEECIPKEPIFPNVNIQETLEVFGTEEPEASAPREPISTTPISTPISVPTSHETAANTDHVSMHADKRSTQFFQEFYIPDEVDTGARDVVWMEEMEQRLRRSQSVPSDYQFFGAAGETYFWCPTLVHSYSSPSSLAMPLSEVESILAEMEATHDVDVVLRLLRRLWCLVRSGGVEGEVREGGGLVMLLEVLTSLSTHPVAMVVTLRTLKYLTRQGDLGEITGEMLNAVLQVMDCHPTSEEILTQACLVLGNIGRSGPDEYARDLVADRSLLTLTHVLQCFPSSPSLLLSAMALLGVGLAHCHPDARLHLLSEHGLLLDVVLLGMSQYPSHVQLQGYAAAFIALLTAEVAVCVESEVMELMVTHVCQAASSCCYLVQDGSSPRGHDDPDGGADVIIWACKALANSATNAALTETKLASRCCDVLVQVLTVYPTHSQVWTCSLYAILQLLTKNGGGLRDLVRDDLMSVLKTPPSSLPQEADIYLQQLHHYLTIL